MSAACKARGDNGANIEGHGHSSYGWQAKTTNRQHNVSVSFLTEPDFVQGLPLASDTQVAEPEVSETSETDLPWIVLVWNDPINLMSYVSFVFQKLFGYSKEKADLLMIDVHEKGRAVVSTGTRERAEIDVFRLHEHGLWATMQKDS